MFESSLKSACCVFSSPLLAPSSHTTLFTSKRSPAFCVPTLFCSETRLKLKSRLWFELCHAASQPTFPTDYKELFFCITFPPLWPNLAPCGAFSQHTSIISALFHCDQIWHILSRKSPTLTLWKSFQIELSQQFPASLSWQNVFIAVQRSCPWSCAPSESLTGERASPH